MPDNWKPYARRTLALEKQFRPKLIRIIKAFRKEFIQDLQTHGKNVAIGNLQQRLAPHELTLAMQTAYKQAGVMGARMTASELKQSEQKATGFGRNERWIRAVIDYLKIHLLGFVQDITETMRNDIIAILQKAVDEGLGIADTVKLLQNEGLIKARASLIARTEINRAANTGHSIAAKELPYEVDKKWIAADDHRTRQSHRMIDNHTTDEHGFFRVARYSGKKLLGYDEMQFPGDPHAHPENTCNCRCRVIYIPKRDSNGKLILRDRTQATIIPMRRVPRLEPAEIAAQLKSHITITVK
jgi:uncharacterized protein with gpF-like domain